MRGRRRDVQTPAIVDLEGEDKGEGGGEKKEKRHTNATSVPSAIVSSWTRTTSGCGVVVIGTICAYVTPTVACETFINILKRCVRLRCKRSIWVGVVE
jgi:hypothetical protein